MTTILHYTLVLLEKFTSPLLEVFVNTDANWKQICEADGTGKPHEGYRRGRRAYVKDL